MNTHRLGPDALTGWLRDAANGAQWIASVCTGAGSLAAASLLHGRRATTHWAYRARLACMGGEVVDERFVFDGRIAAAAGVSAGIDMALALTGRQLAAQGREGGPTRDRIRPSTSRSPPSVA